MPVVRRTRAGVREHPADGETSTSSTFPSPLWHEMDGGRYIGTGCSVVTRDFDTDWVNVGTYRVQVHDSNHVALDMVPGKHGAHPVREAHEGRASASRWRSCCGADPLGYLISGIEVPFGMCEWNYIGAILERAGVGRDAAS